MTEAEWLDWPLPGHLLRHLHSWAEPSDRKLRLFGVACCRRAAEFVPDLQLGGVIEECEQIADALDIRRLVRLNQTVRSRMDFLRSWRSDDEYALFELAFAVNTLTDYTVFTEHAADSCMHAVYGHDRHDIGGGERLFQSDLLRDIFGNPFRPIAFDPSWRTSTAVGLARSMYDSRDFSPMPILADALEDAGCDHPDILAHCRGNGPHVRGCWVVDLVLGKS